MRVVLTLGRMGVRLGSKGFERPAYLASQVFVPRATRNLTLYVYVIRRPL